MNFAGKTNFGPNSSSSVSDVKSNRKEEPARPGRRQQSVGEKANTRTPVQKNAVKAPKPELKDRIPFEYQRNSTSGKKQDNKRTPSRPRDVGTRLNFLSPTVSSKVKQSNQKKNSKSKDTKVYSVEDLNNK